MTKKIDINAGVDPTAVMAVVQQTADELGFLFEPNGATSATVHDGKKEVSGNVTATRARIGIELEPGTLKLKSETTGAIFGAAGAGFFMARINARFSKFAKHTKKALKHRGLA